MFPCPVRFLLCLLLSATALGGPLAASLGMAATRTAGTSVSDAQPASPLRAALLLEHEGQGMDWPALLRAGLEEAGRDLGVSTQAISVPDPAGQEEAFRQAARDFDLVIVGTDRFHEILRNNAANFRKTKFGCVDAGIRAPNIMSITFADEQAAYLAGAAAALLTTQTSLAGVNAAKVIGWLSGEDVPAQRSLFNGFSEGARFIDPEMRVINALANSFQDAAAGRESALRLADQHVDIMALAAGGANAGALDAARQRGFLVLGLDVDQSARLPGRVPLSILKRGDKAVRELVAAAQGDFQGKAILTYDLRNKGVDVTGLERFKAAVGTAKAAGQGAALDAVARRIQELRLELERGSIQLKSLRERTLCDC